MITPFFVILERPVHVRSACVACRYDVNRSFQDDKNSAGLINLSMLITYVTQYVSCKMRSSIIRSFGNTPTCSLKGFQRGGVGFPKPTPPL